MSSGTSPERPATEDSGGLVFDDPLDRQTSDDTDEGWGERRDDGDGGDLDRFLRDKPPHHM